MTNTKDLGQLSIQVDACADRLPHLIVETRRQSNDAIKHGDLNTADALDEQSSELVLLYQTVLRHQIQQIAESDELRNAVRSFADVNKQIDGIIHANENATKFLGTLASILGGLKDVTGKVLS
ncbi:MAG: hypothetical protein AB7F22_23465 [Reyranella sp.]|uniref:hypothetical protein n=1 Tax=Reyranella sp. TaxID=1929291 RepID=UPI003D0C141D